METQGLLEKILDWHERFTIERSKDDNSFYFSRKVDNSFLEEMDSFNSIFSFDYSCIKDGYDISIEWEKVYLKEGEIITISLFESDLNDAGLVVFEDWTSFFERQDYLFSIPDNFLILEESRIFPGDGNNETFRRYQDFNKLLKLLDSNADYVQKKSTVVVDEYIFLHRGRLLLPFVTCEKWKEQEINGLGILLSLFDESSHSEQKKSIFKEALYSFLMNVSEGSRFIYLVDNFGEFAKRVNENFQLFVSEFSFDAVRLEYEEKKREYLVKLNNVLSSVQSKMLGIPVSLAVTALNLGGMNKIQISASTLLLKVAIVIYGFFIFIMLANTNSTLNSIKTEYKGLMNRLEYAYPNESESIEEAKKELNSRLIFQKGILVFFAILAAVMISLTFIFLK